MPAIRQGPYQSLGRMAAPASLTVPTQLVANSVRTWFSAPSAIEYSGGIFLQGVNQMGDVLTDRYDIATLTATRKINHAVIETADDHDEGAAVFTNNGYLTRCYGQHYDTTVRCQVTDRAISNASDWSAASFSSEFFLFTPSVDNTKYSYANAFKLSQTGDRVYLIYRKGLHPDPQAVCEWILRAIDNAHTATPTVGSEQRIWVNAGQFPYFKARSNGVNRIDIVATDIVSPTGAASLYHGYIQLNGSNIFEYFNSAGTIQTGPLSPANGTLVKSNAGGLTWMSDVALDAGGKPCICMQVYPANDYTDIRAYVSRYNGSSWVNTQIAAEGSGIPVASTDNHGLYPGAHVFHPLTTTKAIVSENVSGAREIKEYITTDDWATSSVNRTITSGGSTAAGYFRFRPTRVQDSTGFCNFVWLGYLGADPTFKYDNYFTYNTHQIGIA